MSPDEARRCIAACADYLRRRDDSPKAANDLYHAGRALFEAGVKAAREDACGQETDTDLVAELWGRV